jgi:long-chain acyl-CoA synthetase
VSDLSWPLERARLVRGDAVAVVDGERSITYGGLAARVGALGAALDDLGLGEGARVGYLGVNSLAHLECWLAVPAFGRVLVDLNFRLAVEELAFMVDDAGVEVLVSDAAQLDVARGVRQRCTRLRQLILDAPGPSPGDCVAYEDLVAGPTAPPPGVETDALAAISYTGGTTGTPKGVMLSHGNLLANARHNLIATGHRPEHRFLHVPPMFHVAGTANVFACTWVGATQVLLPRFDAAAVIAAIERERITHTVFVPTMLAMLLDAPELEGADLSSLRHVQYAASPIAPELQRRVLERLPCDVAQFYGMTEAAPTVTHLTPEDHRRGGRRLASVGAPVPGVQVEVRGPAGDRVPAGEVGELWIRGPNVMLGYWNRPDATAEALVDGWYRSGDVVRDDGDGNFSIVDRAKDMIITGGENVYSIEVEAVLGEHPDVLEAAVFGIPDARWGEAVHAIVVAGPGADPSAEELIEHARRRIAGFKVPRSIELRAEPLPKSGAGKVLKSRLREPYWSGHERHVS